MADIGCGSKPYRSFFKNVENYSGYDMANEGHSHTGEHIDVLFDGKTIPAPASSYQSVISSEVLEHVFWPAQWLDEINRILQTGGSFLLTCPFMFHEHEVPNDYGRYSSYGLKYLLEQHGFEITVQRKAAAGLQCVVLQWNVLWWKAFDKILPRPIAFLLSWFFFFPANIVGLLFGWLWKDSHSFYAGNMVVCKKISQVNR
ncbi:MAG: methyltransferase domain-containing protein [Mucilaginibacter sp.]